MKTFSCVFMVVCVAGLSNGMDLSAKLASAEENNQARMASIRDTTEGAMQQLDTTGLKPIGENVQLFFKQFADMQNFCARNENVVKCCAKDLLQNDICLGLDMNTTNFSIKVTLSVNDKMYIDETVSGQNPQPICAPLPQFPILNFCVEPYGLGYSNDTLTVCASLAARIVSKDIARANMSCLMVDKDGNITPFKPTSSAAGTAIFNFDTSTLNPMLNKSINPVQMITTLLKG